jgi:hypothetical protein
MREITRNFGLVTTFRILVDQDRRQLAARMKRHADTNEPILIVPLVDADIRSFDCIQLDRLL